MTKPLRLRVLTDEQLPILIRDGGVFIRLDPLFVVHPAAEAVEDEVAWRSGDLAEEIGPHVQRIDSWK